MPDMSIRHLDTGRYAVADADRFIADSISGLFDHGRDRFIISVHLTKTLLAGRQSDARESLR